jgi:hypothetical protein
MNTALFKHYCDEKSTADFALIIAKQSVLNWQYAADSCKYVWTPS